MTTIRWSPQAADDLIAIRDYIARDSAQYAGLVVQRIAGAIELLATAPRALQEKPIWERHTNGSAYYIRKQHGNVRTRCHALE